MATAAPPPMSQVVRRWAVARPASSVAAAATGRPASCDAADGKQVAIFIGFDFNHRSTEPYCAYAGPPEPRSHRQGVSGYNMRMAGLIIARPLVQGRRRKHLRSRQVK